VTARTLNCAITRILLSNFATRLVPRKSVNTSVILTVNKDSGKYQWCNKLPEDHSQTSFYLLAYSTNRTGIFQSNISFTRPQFLWTSSTPLKFVTTYHGATRANPMLGNSEIEPSLINILLWTHSGTCMKSAFFVPVQIETIHTWASLIDSDSLVARATCNCGRVRREHFAKWPPCRQEPCGSRSTAGKKTVFLRPKSR
jgi:hypothetical protein